MTALLTNENIVLTLASFKMIVVIVWRGGLELFDSKLSATARSSSLFKYDIWQILGRDLTPTKLNLLPRARQFQVRLNIFA